MAVAARQAAQPWQGGEQRDVLRAALGLRAASASATGGEAGRSCSYRRGGARGLGMRSRREGVAMRSRLDYAVGRGARPSPGCRGGDIVEFVLNDSPAQPPGDRFVRHQRADAPARRRPARAGLGASPAPSQVQVTPKTISSSDSSAASGAARGTRRRHRDQARNRRAGRRRAVASKREVGRRCAVRRQRQRHDRQRRQEPTAPISTAGEQVARCRGRLSLDHRPVDRRGDRHAERDRGAGADAGRRPRPVRWRTSRRCRRPATSDRHPGAPPGDGRARSAPPAR